MSPRANAAPNSNLESAKSLAKNRLPDPDLDLIPLLLFLREMTLKTSVTKIISKVIETLIRRWRQIQIIPERVGLLRPSFSFTYVTLSIP
jgi:hypothetical protein